MRVQFYLGREPKDHLDFWNNQLAPVEHSKNAKKSAPNAYNRALHSLQYYLKISSTERSCMHFLQKQTTRIFGENG